MNVTFDGANFDFTATLNGTVGETPGAKYVFGINRGQGTAKFSNIGHGGVLFDSTFTIDTAGQNVVKDLINQTTTAITDVTISGATISGVVPLSDLPSEGFSPINYQTDLWPEAGPATPANTNISDFAPDNSDAPVSTTPEPGTMSLFGMAAGGAFVALGRRKRKITGS